VKISAVDQSPIFSNTDANSAIRETIELAKFCDSLGMHRFWVAEHHGSDSFAGCSPEILIPSLANATNSIRIGSGGVMLMHYSPYKIAENFRLLESLFPGRIDLGLGRAPGSNPYQAGALAYGSKTTGSEFFNTKLNDLKSFLLGEKPQTDAFELVDVTPGLGSLPELWLLVSSENGADIASFFGLPMSLAHFIEKDCLHLADRYRKNFKPSIFSDSPRVSLAIFSICAETDQQAIELSSSASLWRKRIQKGESSCFPSKKEALEEIDYSYLSEAESRPFVGSQETIQKRLNPMVKAVNPEELKVITICEPFQEKKESYKLLKELFN
tara:strand:+ start:5412 stop:6392 length:981 start_codon:yes stop_codon:yes gene_type:complete